MKVEIDLPEIEGYEYTGEYRCPKAGEYYLDGSGRTVSCHYGSRGDTYGVRFHILRKKRWRAEIGQAYYRVIAGHLYHSNDGIYVEQTREAGHPDDAVRCQSGNYFQTKEEAEAMAEKVRALFKEGL